MKVGAPNTPRACASSVASRSAEHLLGEFEEGAAVEAKKEINKLYKQLYTKLRESSPEDALKLEKSQKAWLIYRNNYCELAGLHIGSPLYYVCPMDLNIQRVSELRQFFD